MKRAAQYIGEADGVWPGHNIGTASAFLTAIGEFVLSRLVLIMGWL